MCLNSSLRCSSSSLRTHTEKAEWEGQGEKQGVEGRGRSLKAHPSLLQPCLVDDRATSGGLLVVVCAWHREGTEQLSAG